jgi:LysM repeat protein
MNTPNPLMPQGSLPQLQSKAKSTVRILLVIAAVHAVFFTGVLLSQGCGPKTDTAGLKSTKPTNNIANELPGIDTNYYSSFRDIPSANTNPLPPIDLGAQHTNQPLVSTPPSSPPIVRETPAAEAKEYTIVRGDNLGKIALAHKVKVGAIAKANPGLDPAKLRPGQKIQIPAPSAPAATIGSTEPGTGDSGAGTTHVVKAGENLTMIAKQHKTTPKAIKAANNMKTDQVLVGKKLKIPAPSPAPSNASKPAPGSPLSDRTMPLRASSTTTNVR